jgi:hypothetical protein
MGGNRLVLTAMVIMLALLATACTSASPPRTAAKERATSSTPGRPTASTKVSSALEREGLLVPSTYQQACAIQSADCPPDTAGVIPAALKRPLHFPVLRPGQRCPASPGSPVNTSEFGGTALGKGLVRVLIADTGDLRHGVADLINPTSSPPWLALKTLWFSMPTYQGPFVIRAKRLGQPGPAALGEGPTVAPLVVPPGPTLNSGEGYREAPGGLWVRTPGCYAWQVDGLTFSEVLVVRAVLQ